jgi:cytochrome c biogenesis protein CcdA
LGLFAVAVGLVLGSFFSSQQEMSAWMALLLVIFVGAMLVDALELQLPASLQAMIPWVPSVALVDVMRISFLKDVPWAEVWTNLGRVLSVSVLLYALVVWKVRQGER